MQENLSEIQSDPRQCSELAGFGLGDSGRSEVSRRHAADLHHSLPSLESVMHCRPNKQPVVFVFAGQGSQWWGMGRELLRTEPRFHEFIQTCDRLFHKFGADWSLLDEFRCDESCSRLEETSIAQPAIFALQAGLVELWKSWGIEPDAVIGHSIGEVAAAYAAGMLSLHEAARVVFHRGRCMDDDLTGGRLLAAAVSEEEARNLLADNCGTLELAAVNGPASVTFAGTPEELKQLSSQLRAAKKWRKMLPIPHAFHSAAMEPLREGLLTALGPISVQPAEIPMISTVSGNPVAETSLDADYWWQNMRQPVRFADACQWAVRRDYQVFLEIGPHPVLSGCITQCAGECELDVSLFPSLRRDDEDSNVMLNSVAGLFSCGASIRRHRPGQRYPNRTRSTPHVDTIASFDAAIPGRRRSRLNASSSNDQIITAQEL